MPVTIFITVVVQTRRCILRAYAGFELIYPYGQGRALGRKPNPPLRLECALPAQYPAWTITLSRYRAPQTLVF